MEILNIKNRTENWKTATCFAPFFANRNRLASLAKRLGESSDLQPIVLELFWKGMRDYVYKNKETDNPEAEFSSKFAKLYNYIFASTASPHGQCQLREQVSKSGKFRDLKDHNYNPYALNSNGQDHQEKLYTNLCNTEIDIVLQTPTHLFIGEAKYKSALGSDRKLVLVHQLIRQYVMARILLAIVGKPELVVVPFLVVENRQTIKNALQVRFMMGQKWLKGENILSWDDIRGLCTE